MPNKITKIGNDTTFFKYWDKDKAKRFLGNLKIMFSHPSQFNDPFEFADKIEYDYTEQEYRDFVTENIHLSPNDPVFSSVLNLYNHQKKQVDRIVDEEIHSAKEKLGVFCLSRTPAGLLMWAHYADEHKGFCIGIDTSKDRKTFKSPKSVIYDTAFPSYNYVRDCNEVERSITTKSKEWEYEQEVRYIKIKGAQTLHDVDPAAVTCIIFGTRCPDVDKQEIISLAKSQGLHHLKYYQAHLSPNTYSLYFTEAMP